MSEVRPFAGTKQRNHSVDIRNRDRNSVFIYRKRSITSNQKQAVPGGLRSLVEEAIHAMNGTACWNVQIDIGQQWKRKWLSPVLLRLLIQVRRGVADRENFNPALFHGGKAGHQFLERRIIFRSELGIEEKKDNPVPPEKSFEFDDMATMVSDLKPRSELTRNMSALRGFKSPLSHLPLTKDHQPENDEATEHQQNRSARNHPVSVQELSEPFNAAPTGKNIRGSTRCKDLREPLNRFHQQRRLRSRA